MWVDPSMTLATPTVVGRDAVGRESRAQVDGAISRRMTCPTADRSPDAGSHLGAAMKNALGRAPLRPVGAGGEVVFGARET